jgi:hypothetical protein
VGYKPVGAESISMLVCLQLITYWNMNNPTCIAGLEFGSSELEMVSKESILSLPGTIQSLCHRFWGLLSST